jgi:hypothetical protein
MRSVLITEGLHLAPLLPRQRTSKVGMCAFRGIRILRLWVNATPKVLFWS